MANVPMASVVAAGALLLSMTGCGDGPTTGPAQKTVTIGDRSVSSFLDVAGDIQKEGETAVITADGVKVTIEKARVVIDGNDSGAIPPNAKRVDVTIVANMLTVNADDNVVASKSVKAKESK